MKRLSAFSLVAVAILVLVAFLCVVPCMAQAPTQSTVNFNLGGSAFGLGGSSQATAASDVFFTINPGITKLPNFSLRADTILAPGADFQFYAPGAQNQFGPFTKTGLLSQIYLTVNVGAGIERIVPSSGPSQSHFGFMAGVSANYVAPGKVVVNLFEAGYMYTPGAPWGSSTPYYALGAAKSFFGSPTSATARARVRSRNSLDAQNFTPTL